MQGLDDFLRLDMTLLLVLLKILLLVLKRFGVFWLVFFLFFFAGAWFSTCDEMVSLKLVGDGRQGFGEEVSSVGEKRGALVQWRVPLTGSVSYRPPLHGLASPTDGAEGQRLRRVFIV